MSFAPEVKVAGDEKWCGNALRFATRKEAEANVEDLMMRWLAVVDTRVVESRDSVNYRWINGKLVDIEHVQEAAEVLRDYDRAKNG